MIVARARKTRRATFALAGAAKEPAPFAQAHHLGLLLTTIGALPGDGQSRSSPGPSAPHRHGRPGNRWAGRYLPLWRSTADAV